MHIEGLYDSIVAFKSMFSRLSMLIGKEALDALKAKRVLIFGLGGVGGHCCDALARSGIVHFDIVDHDVVSFSNINRQIIASQKSVGRKKVDVMEEHLLDINPEITVVKHDCFYLPENSETFDFASYDYVIDAIDTVAAKVDIIVKCHQEGVPVISAMGCGNRLDPSGLTIMDLFKTHDDPLAKVMRQQLRKQGVDHQKVVCSTSAPLPHIEEVESDDPHRKVVPGSSAFVPSSAGIMMAYEVIKDLLKL